MEPVPTVVTDNLGATKTSAPITITIVSQTLVAVRLTDGLVELTWPLSATGYHVETAPSLTAPVLWQSVTNSVAQTNGVFRVLVEPGEAERYFRLTAP